MFEYHAICHKNEYYLANPDDLELEHIVPKAADKPGTKIVFGDWPTYLGEGGKTKHSKMLHRDGNMTLLADELNVVASNNPFFAKRKDYAKSNIRLTKHLADYSNFKFKTIEYWSQAFAQQAVKIWKV
ncbi:HNH endonuclease [Burkholderia sp. Ax-1719]|nr:HNH endonuclease family protein [Burkholderia sp. Ax-1719]NIE64469.1 HNH endonuclease [Burkholderia sp. Ax-1719]